MGAEGAASIIFRRRLSTAAEPREARRELVAEYTEQLMNPFVAARRGHGRRRHRSRGHPAGRRSKSLDMLRTKRVREPLRKHGNEPL